MMKKRQRPKNHLQTYHRLNKDSDDSSEETELIVKKQFYEPTIEKVVEEGDTLQSLSLRYHCPIAELKRLNNIHRENEIFAKRIIKVPLRPFSMSVPSVHISGNSTPIDAASTPETKVLDLVTLKTKLNDNIDREDSSSSNNLVEVNQIIFNSDVKPIVNKSCDNLIPNEINEGEHVNLLYEFSSVPVADTVVTRLSFNGADADISWKALFVCIVIVIFAVPLIYVFYIAEHPEHYHHDHYS